jgi:hypothetical protein
VPKLARPSVPKSLTRSGLLQAADWNWSDLPRVRIGPILMIYIDHFQNINDTHKQVVKAC